MSNECTKLCLILLMPFILVLIILLTLLSHNIFSNIIFSMIAIVIVAIPSSFNQWNVFVYINIGYIARNILHIIVLCIFRYPLNIFRIIFNILSSLPFIILSIHFETSYYIILLSLITIISEFWIKSSKKSIKNCEYNLLRLLYFENYHISY
eukprot:426291_1